MKAFDAHVHLSVQRDDLLRRYADLNGLEYTLEELLARMRKHGVEKGLLLSPPAGAGGIVPNEQVLDLCGKSGGALSPVVTVEPTEKEVRDATALAEAERKSVKGFKVRLGYIGAAADDKVFGPLYDYAEGQGLPVLFHTGDTATSDGQLALSHPLELDRLANKREGMKVVLCHFGNPWIDTAAELIYKHPNVYADISGLTTGGGVYADRYSSLLARKLSEAIYFAGSAEKILFGTDYPVTRHEDALKLVELMEVDPSDKERVLWRNATELFGI